MYHMAIVIRNIINMYIVAFIVDSDPGTQMWVWLVTVYKHSIIINMYIVDLTVIILCGGFIRLCTVQYTYLLLRYGYAIQHSPPVVS